MLAGIIYNTPSAVFPVRHADGTYGGNSTYGANNPVALLESTGNYRTTYGTLLANATLKQELDALLKGLSAEVSVAFDNSGSMYDTATKEYKYMDTQASMLPDDYSRQLRKRFGNPQSRRLQIQVTLYAFQHSG